LSLDPNELPTLSEDVLKKRFDKVLADRQKDKDKNLGGTTNESKKRKGGPTKSGEKPKKKKKTSEFKF